MAKPTTYGLIEKSILQDIGNAIRTKKGTTDAILASNMASEILSIVTEPTLQEKTITPTKLPQTIKADTGFDGLSQVVVNAIPSNYIDTSDANATTTDILSGKTAYINGVLVTGTIQTWNGEEVA